MLNNFKKTIEFLGLNYKKEQIKIIISNVVLLTLFAVLMIFNRTPFVIVMGVLVILGINYYIFSSYSLKKQKLNKDRADEFVYVISYFRIFISSRNNVYQSFNKIIDYSSDWMKEKLEIFLRAIDGDKSIKPFTDLADRFELPIARNVLVSIYQMVEQGETSEQLNQFTILFEQMSKTLNDERKDRKLRSFDLVGFFPIVGAGLVTIALTFSMLSLVGDMINVI